MKTDVENEGHLVIKCGHDGPWFMSAEKNAKICGLCGKTKEEIKQDLDSMIEEREEMIASGRVITGVDLSAPQAEAAFFIYNSQVRKSAQEDALRRYALIERVLRCPPATLSALESTLGMRDVAMKSFMKPSDLLGKAEIEE